jgi:hypothetical protein
MLVGCAKRPARWLTCPMGSDERGPDATSTTALSGVSIGNRWSGSKVTMLSK